MQSDSVSSFELDIDLDISPELLQKLQLLSDGSRQVFRMYGKDHENVFFLNDPLYIKHVLQSNNRNYTKGIGIDQVKMLLGNGIMVSEGDFWLRQRRLIQPSFHKRNLEDFFQLMIAENESLIARWSELAESDAAMEVTEEMSKITLEIVLRALFGEDLDFIKNQKDGNPFNLLTEEVNRDLRFAMKFRGFAKHIIKVIQKRDEEDRWPHDFLTMLIHSTDKKTGQHMNQKEIIDEVMTLIVAGHETTASALSWAWYLLSENPAIVDQVRAESAQFFSANELTMHTVGELSYTRMLVDEVLRLYPPGWLFSRRAIEDDEIDGLPIPAGSDILISPYLLHRNEKLWDTPEAFQPERFSADRQSTISKFGYLPFAIGPRQCIGDMFALHEMIVHLAMVVPKFQFERIKPAVVEMEPEINLRPKEKIYFKIKKIS